jgi:RNA polymerase sigma-70 factor (ECF subfamily)
LLAVEEFERYYEDIRPGLLRFVAARLRDPHAAADLVQDVYAKAFRSLEQYDKRRPFSTWIYAIARNACVDFLRRRARDPLAGAAANAPAPPPELDTLPATGDYDPAFAAERRDLVDAAREELEKLPDIRRAAVEMKVLEGLTFREVAEALDTPLGTVAFWVRESLDAIAERLRHLR